MHKDCRVSYSIDLDKRIALVTGASSGLGAQFARTLSRAGATVVLASRRKNKLEDLRAELQAAGGAAHVVEMDVTDTASIQAAVAQAEAEVGPIELLVNNSGVSTTQRLQDVSPQDFDFVFDTNVKGTLFSVQAALESLTASGHGRIILTSSITGPITGFPGWAHYGASKAAQLGFMRTAAVELAGRGITVNAILPGNIATEGLDEMGADYIASMEASIPLRRLGTVADIGNLAVFLSADEAAYITGQAIAVDGGQVLPESLAALNV
jgi:3-oxoacyl-[acyl-carrier protein] reductase